MAFEATKNFKKKSAGGRFEATSNFGVDDTVISSRVNAISKDIESLYNDYYKDYTERSKYVLGVDSKYENMQAPGLKVSMQSYKDRAKKIKQSIEDNKAFLTPEGYLAALQNVNSIIDTDTTEDDKTFSDYFNSSAAAGGRDKYNKIVEERAAAQSALKKAGLNENSKYRDIEAALSDRTIDAGAAPDEMGQGRRYQGRKLTSEDKDYLSSLLLTEDKVSTMTDDEILRKIKDKGNPSYKQKIALGEIDRLTKRNEELIKLAEADGNVSSFNPYGDYAEEYANNQQRMEKLRNMIDNDYAGRDVAYYYTDDNGSAAAMSWENLYYERKVGNAYKAATDKGYGGYNSAAAAAYDEINFIEKVTDAMQWLSENSTVSAEKKKPYLDIVKEYDEKYGTNYAKEDGIYSIETKNRINSEIKNSDALNKLKENFKSESGATYDAVKDYAKLQRDKERAAKVQETVQTAVEGVNSVPVVGKALGGIASAISAVPFALVSGTDYIFNLMDSIGHSDYNSDSFRPINTYDDYVTNISSEIIGTQTEIYDKAMQEAGVSERARKFWTSTYSGFSSGINSLATVVGSCYAFGPAAGQVVASVILSGQAASSGLQEAVQNGSTTNEALAYGFASGVAEYLGEKISIGSLVDKFLESSFDVTSFKSFMKSFVKDKNLLKMLGQGAVEGSEEVVTEIMNRFSDAVINQDHSKFSNAILTYEAEGLSREEAKKKAFLDVLASAAEQAWGGFVGGIMGGTAAVIGGGVSAARNSVADIKNQTDIGKSIAGTDAGKNVLEIAEKRGFDISKASEEVPEGRGVGKLVSKVRNAVRNRNMGKLAQNVVEAELKAAKETAMPIVNNNESLAEMVAEIATGTADVSAISALSANGVLTEENVEKVFEALEAVQKRTETSEVRNMINDIVETKESSEGKAYNASSIYGIKREGGKTKYILEDGTEVDSGEFGLTSKDKTLFVNAVKGMTDAEANEMISAYRKYANGTDKGVFATTWGLYRSLGETGAAKNSERVAGYKSRIYFTQDAEVNNVLVTSAIEQGVKARAQSEMKRNIKARAERVIQERGRAKGEVRGEEHLGKNKSGAKNVARTLAKLGYDVEFLSEDAKLHGKRIGDTLINGAYDAETNTIYLRADATYNATDVRGILGHTLAHEVTHSIKVWSEADYNVLTDFIRDALEADFDALVKEKMDKLGMSYAMASDEVIADGCEMLLRDSKALEKLAMENANLFVKVASKVREFIANLRKAQTDMYDGNEELHDAALKLREALKSLEEVQEVFDNALENSIRNMRDALAEAENAKTRENLDVLEKQAEKEGLQLSEEITFDNSSTQKKIYDIIKSGMEDEDGKSFDQRFRDIQEACREMSQEELQLYRERRAKLDERVRTGLEGYFRRRILSGSGSDGNVNALTLSYKAGNRFRILTVDAVTFHDVFEICRCFLKNGELVDLHGIKTTADSIGYEDMTNYITDDGMSGFAITKDGDLVSVYNLGTKRGFLGAIAPVVKERTSTLDCYMSPNQPLSEIYERKFGFKIASVMDYNMEYDHDNIAKNHHNPQIAFMVNSDSDVQTRHFSKDDYDGAKNYQLEQASEVQYSEETETSRDTLVSDMEAVAETDEEKSFVEKLKSEVKKANALQKELAEVNRKIKEASFTKGADRSVLPSLNEERERIAKKLNRLDSKFYGYRGYDTFKTLAERKSKEAVIAERLRGKEALRSQKQKYQEAAQGIKDTLAQREENRRRREIVRDIAKRIDKLDKLAKEDSKTKHIPSALRDIVKAFREQIDSRTQNYDERIARAENAIASLEKKRGKYLDAYTEYTQLSERIKQYDKGSKDYADADARMGQLKQDFDRYNSLTEQIEKKLSSIEKSGERNVRAADYLSEMLSYYKTYDNADSTYYIDVSDLARAIEDLRHSIGERPLYLLTADQLEDVLAVTKAVQKKISDANKLFRSSRSVSETTAKVAGETKDARNKKVSRSDFVRGAKDRTANMLYWNNLKPYELFKQSGSDTLYQLYRNLQRAEGDSGRLILKYADKYRETAQKYGIKEKMFNQKFDITFDNGKTARLTGGEILTLYLTAKRGQGRVHLLGDGFRLEGGKMRLVADGKETVYANADMMTLTENDLTKFGKTLSDDMCRFGDEMQKYMSTEIAADGNAVSMKLYDIMLFGEDNYITLTVDNNYLRSTIDPKNNTAKLKNSKFTIKTVANATQALSISSFVNVYQTHASDMAAYAAFTLPLEDITKVINGTSKSEDGSTRVRDVLGSKLYGEMMKFLTDVNGGIRSDGDLAYMRLFSAVKAARTGLNLAVAIQQPCAVMRAFAEINPKYFIGVKAKTMSEAQQRKSLAEMTQYASTWVVKQLGGVDINTKQSIGKTITDLGAKGNTFGHTAAKGLQEGQFWVAEKLDQVTWMWIWNACRNEAIDNFKKSNADYTYKDVLKKAGDRFDEITNKTQVYDSIFARSKIMRDGKAFEKFITQFMAEPITTLNMAYDGIRHLMNGEKGKAAGIFASLIASQIFTAAIRSFADAFRDDDDDKNYWEKYLQAFIENSIDNINPFMLLPWFKDIYSLVFNGFNVDRPDVEIIGDLMTKVKKLAKVWGDESKNAKERAEASWDALSILADMSGVAMTSLTRDFRAIYRTITTEWQSATKTTTNTAADTAWKNGLSRNLTTPRDDKGKLYYAFMNDDDTYIARTQDRLGEKDFRRRVIDCLKDNDIRIAEAAAAHMDGDYEKYDSIIRDIANDGFDKEYVVAAVVSAENKALKDSADEDEDVDTVSQIDGMTATKKDIIADVEEGNYDLLEEYYRLKVDYYKEKEADDPEGKAFTSVRSLLSGHYRDLYKDGDEDERERIADILGDVTVDGHKVIKKSTVRKWKED